MSVVIYCGVGLVEMGSVCLFQPVVLVKFDGINKSSCQMSRDILQFLSNAMG